jgi:membrane-associated protease RseP (regulator of RpoE activity)
MSPSLQNTIRTVIIAVILGGASGVLATALTANYLSQYALELGELTEPLRLTQEKPRAVPQVYAQALDQLEKNALPAVGAVFGATIPSVGFVSADQRAGLVSLTSDGWMLSAEALISSHVVMGEQTCAVDRVLKDALTGLSFAHCDVNSVPVVVLGDGYDLQPGDQVFVVDGPERLFFTEVSSLSWGVASARSSDVPARRVNLAKSFKVLPGASVFNISGELVGMIDPSGDGARVVPFEHVSGAFKSVLEGAKQIDRATLGVRFIDLSRTTGLSSDLTRGIHSGALLSGSQAVEWGSAAYDAGLRVGDIILALDGIFIDSNNSLDDLVVTYDPGSIVRILIDRAGERVEINATLGR